MVYQETSTAGFYDIYIAASVENPDGKSQSYMIISIDPSDSDYYIAKFSTQYNITEYYDDSRVKGVNETVRGLRYDKDNQFFYLAVEVDSNTYKKATSTWETEAQTDLRNQTNIAIVAYDRYCK